MSDNVIRGLRTAVQAVLGFVATGALTRIWEDYLGRHEVDPTIVLAVGLALTYLVAWAQNEVEDRTGKRLGPVPKDRKIGDATIGTGIGAKTG